MKRFKNLCQEICDKYLSPSEDFYIHEQNGRNIRQVTYIPSHKKALQRQRQLQDIHSTAFNFNVTSSNYNYFYDPYNDNNLSTFDSDNISSRWNIFLIKESKLPYLGSSVQSVVFCLNNIFGKRIWFSNCDFSLYEDNSIKFRYLSEVLDQNYISSKKKKKSKIPIIKDGLQSFSSIPNNIFYKEGDLAIGFYLEKKEKQYFSHDDPPEITPFRVNGFLLIGENNIYLSKKQLKQFLPQLKGTTAEDIYTAFVALHKKIIKLSEHERELLQKLLGKDNKYLAPLVSGVDGVARMKYVLYNRKDFSKNLYISPSLNSDALAYVKSLLACSTPSEKYTQYTCIRKDDITGYYRPHQGFVFTSKKTKYGEIDINNYSLEEKTKYESMLSKHLDIISRLSGMSIDEYVSTLK